MFVHRGGARHFHLWGPLEGSDLQQGELPMVCVGLFRKRPNLGGTLEGPDLQQGELSMVCVGLFRKRPNLGGTLEGPD